MERCTVCALARCLHPCWRNDSTVAVGGCHLTPFWRCVPLRHKAATPVGLVSLEMCAAHSVCAGGSASSWSSWAEDQSYTVQRCASAGMEAGTESQCLPERRGAGLRLRVATGTGRGSKLRAEGGKSVAKVPWFCPLRTWERLPTARLWRISSLASRRRRGT